MKTRNLNPKDNKVISNLVQNLKNVVLVDSSPVDEFYRETQFTDDGKEAVRFPNPLFLLFNQQRLNKLGTMGIEAWLAQFDNKKNSPLEELRKKCSDSDLATMIKSRHLQSPAEILAWSRYMYDNMKAFDKELQDVLKAQSETADAVMTENSDNVNVESKTQ